MNRFQAWYRVQPRALRALLTINVVAYVLWQVLLIHFDVTRRFVVEHVALNPAFPGILLEPWQLVTYGFLHLEPGFWGLIHILFNMLWLVWIGREYEELHGAHRLLAVYLLGSLGGGLLTVFLHALFPSVGAFGGIVHGASASVLAVLTVVAVTYPYKSIALLFIGTVRLIYVVIGFLALDILFLAGGGTSVSAHLGGALFGFLFARAEAGGIDLSSWARLFFRSRRPRRASTRRDMREGEGLLGQVEAWLASRRAERAGQPDGPARPASPGVREPLTDADGNSLEGEVDRILDKISEQGYDALTDEEKRILYEASRR
ncbi:rhomboid family intramembrane serine protease [Rhodocaloribacter litoris]|uniref:rhomboid family intramembrane serine protease n=1 Tax=Rhodocaloribacter litoris TaxID=2558931 RepID=UPI00141D86B5|nr:rhomboid family intramembrane serine protease [Rhodocaloribacter litoris]QXD15873.1 rhomboid family intramembrane serine protease [Rhodocaloribacter litoris]